MSMEIISKTNQYRLTKYDPALRRSDGTYPTNDWTGSDVIGRRFKGKKFSLKDYLLIENQYITVIRKFLSTNKIKAMKISDLEIHPKSKTSHFGFAEGDWVELEMILVMSRLIMRDEFWCKLSSNGNFIHFGYDLYVFLGSAKKMLRSQSGFKKFGDVYLEHSVSPYSKKL